MTHQTPHDILLYTDWARFDDGRAGGAYVVYQAGQKVLAHKFCIESKVESIDTEIIAIKSGLQSALGKASTRFSENIIVYTDNQTAARVVNESSSLTCRKEVQEIREIQKEGKSRERLPHVQVGNVMAVWIPSHSRLNGNEEADQLAKRAAQEALSRRSNDKMTHAAVKKLSLTKKAEIECDWWRNYCPAT